jgi:glutamyl-tRNA synthetase
MSSKFNRSAPKRWWKWRTFDEAAAKKHLRPVAEEALVNVRDALAAVTDWMPETIYKTVVDVAESLDAKMGKVAQPLRVAVSGCAATPSIDQTLYLVGKEACLRRIDKALVYIRQRAEPST